jgi:hypothetical protein
MGDMMNMDCDEASVQADKATVAGSAVYHAAMPTREGHWSRGTVMKEDETGVLRLSGQ